MDHVALVIRRCQSGIALIVYPRKPILIDLIAEN